MSEHKARTIAIETGWGDIETVDIPENQRIVITWEPITDDNANEGRQEPFIRICGNEAQGFEEMITIAIPDGLHAIYQLQSMTEEGLEGLHDA